MVKIDIVKSLINMLFNRSLSFKINIYIYDFPTTVSRVSFVGWLLRWRARLPVAVGSHAIFQEFSPVN